MKSIFLPAGTGLPTGCVMPMLVGRFEYWARTCSAALTPAGLPPAALAEVPASALPPHAARARSAAVVNRAVVARVRPLELVLRRLMALLLSTGLRLTPCLHAVQPEFSSGECKRAGSGRQQSCTRLIASLQPASIGGAAGGTCQSGSSTARPRTRPRRSRPNASGAADRGNCSVSTWSEPARARAMTSASSGRVPQNGRESRKPPGRKTRLRTVSPAPPPPAHPGLPPGGGTLAAGADVAPLPNK